jgi:hypothetical protein
VFGDRDVHDPSPLVREDDEHEEQAVGHGRYPEEVGRHHVTDVIRQERAPGLRWWPSVTVHVLRDRGLAHHDSDFPELTVDPGRTPEII